MAYTIQNMDGKSPSHTVFSRLNPQKMEFLTPAPVSPRVVTCDQNASVHSRRPISSSFVNYKIKIPNNSGKKRKLDDSSLNDCYGSKVKKTCIPVSPDLGCFMDYSSPLGGRDSMSPFTPSYPALSENAHTRRAKANETVSTLLDLEHVESGCSSYLKDEVDTKSSKSDKILLRLSPTFDHDVDDILCLNPLNQKGNEENKEEKPSLVAVEDDKGYVSTSHDQKEERHADFSPEPQHHEQAPIRGQQVSFLNDDLNTSEPLLKPANSSVGCLEGDVDEEEGWNIGAPLFESSVCQSSAAVEHRRRISGVDKEPDYVCQGYSAGDSILETTYEESLPLQVQVKSKVEIPCRPGIGKPSQGQKANQNGDKTIQRVKRVRSQSFFRSNVWNNKTEWERQKRHYVASVTSHMAENKNTAQGFVSELEHLMTHVSDQTRSNGDHWQHPSDLTVRNYQKQFGNEIPTMTLSEWQAKNLNGHRRFCKVPKIFDRSPFP